MPDFNLKENWDKFTASIPQWIKNNIFDPGQGAARGGMQGGGSPIKIFGMELKFPSLNISFSGMADKIKALLPEWLTDPAGYIKGLVADMAKLLPGFGKDKTPEQVKAEKTAEDKAKFDKESDKRNANTTRREKVIAEKEEELRQSQLFIKTGGKKGKDTVSNVWSSDDVRKEKEDVASKEADIAKLITQNEKAKASDLEFKKSFKTLAKAGTTPGSIYTHDQGLYDKLDKIFSPQLINNQRTEQILQAGLQRGAAGGGGGGPALVNAPVNTINNSQSNTTITSTELKHPSAILNRVNVAA